MDQDKIDITKLPIIETRQYWPPGSMEWRIQQFKDHFQDQPELTPDDSIIRHFLEMIDDFWAEKRK